MTRLGNSAQTLKAGRYARLMGTLWRHEKTERVGDAALGLFARILSFLADQAQEVVSEKRMVELFRSSPNGRRQLNQLLAAGFMEQVPGGGYAPHDWSEHNRVTKPVRLRVVKNEPEMKMRGTCDDVVMNAPPEIIEEPCVSRARPLTQDPVIKKQPPPTAGCEAAPAPRPREPRKVRPKEPREPRAARPRDARKATFRRVLEQVCAASGVLVAGALMPSQLAAAAQKAAEYAEREGIEYESAARKLSEDAAQQVQDGRKSALCWALRDWQPNAAPRPSWGRQRLEIAPCSPAHEFESEEVAYAKVRARRAEIEAKKAAKAAALTQRQEGLRVGA